MHHAMSLPWVYSLFVRRYLLSGRLLGLSSNLHTAAPDRRVEEAGVTKPYRTSPIFGDLRRRGTKRTIQQGL
jgi:hypothetical protein